VILNPDHIKKVIELANRSAYFKLLSISIRELGIGYSVVEMQLKEKHFTSLGEIHGGAYASLIDTAAYWAIYCDLDETSGLISLDVSVNNLATTTEGIITAKGKRIKFGKTICLAEAKVFNEANTIVAYGNSKLMVSKGLKTVEQVRQFLGNKPFPPKFVD